MNSEPKVPDSTPSIQEGETQPNERKIVYYLCGRSLIATVGEGYDGFYRLVEDPEKSWEPIDINSPQGDSLHREIFQGYKADWLQTPPDAPPVPLTMPFFNISREEYHQKRSACPIAEAPRLASVIRRFGKNELAVYVVLKEDLYESHQGDGTFHYFESAYLAEVDAARRLARSNAHYQYHLRSFKLYIQGDEIMWRDFKLTSADHYDPNRVIAELETSLRNPLSHVMRRLGFFFGRAFARS